MIKAITHNTYYKFYISAFASLLVILTLICFIQHANAASDDQPEKYVHIEIISNKNNVGAGDTVRIGVHKTIHPTWHTYWKNPGDSGTPAQITWTLPDNFTMSDIEWPAPKKIPYGPLANYGHEGQVTLLQDLSVPESYDGKTPFTITADINLLVCHDICIPETHQASLTFNTKNSHSAPEKIKIAQDQLPNYKNWPSTYTQQSNNLHIQISPDTPIPGKTIRNPTLIPEEWGIIDNLADVTLTQSSSNILLSQARGERDLSEINETGFILTYTGQDNQKYAIHIVANPLNVSANQPAKDTKDQPLKTTVPENQSKNTIILWQALIFALLGGAILNLMPCVFPVLSMKALSLVKLQGEANKTAQKSGLAYSAGILLSFAIIGGILIALKASGEQIGWGFQLQSPAIIIALIYLVFIIGLNLANFFEFSAKLSNIGQNLTRKDGHKGAFFTGVLATLVATPCTAPFMAGALGFALTQDAITALLIFLCLGIGLALPYLALCYIPFLRRHLPRPGAWMETFRQFLAFPMFLTSAWLIWVLSQQVNSLGIFMALSGLIAIVFIIWLKKRSTANIFTQIILLLSLVFILAVPFGVTHHNTTKPHSKNKQEQLGQNWENFSPEKLKTALKTNQPVFVNMTAAWCITCKVNEKVAISTTKTKELFVQKNILYLKGDWTNQNPEITSYLQRFNRSGVPLYVYYPAPDEQTGERANPITLPQILTPNIVKKIVTDS